MKKTLLLLFILATLSAIGQVRPPLEANTVRALTELDARKTIKFQQDSLHKAIMAYVEWNANCFRFKRLTAASAWSPWICAPDEVTLDANAQDVFEIPSGKLTFKSTGKNMALRVDDTNKYEFAGTIILNDDYTAFGKDAAVVGYDTVVVGIDTTYVPIYDSTYKNVILLGHNSKAFQDSAAFIGDSTIKQLWIAGSLNTKGVLLEGDSAYMKHLILQEADSGKIAKHMGNTIGWVNDDPDSLYFQGSWYVMGLDSISFADSIQINGQWVKFGESLTFPDSIEVNGEWVHLGGSVTITIPDAQTLSWNSSTGEISISGGNTVDLDGRYLTVETPQNLSWNGSTGALGISGGTGVNLDGRYLSPPTATDGQIMIKAGTIWVASNLPADERARVVYLDGSSSVSALFSSEDFKIQSVGGAIDDNVIFAKSDSLFSALQNKWVYSGDTIETQVFEGDSLYLASENRWLYSGDTIPAVSANIGGAALLGNFDLSDTIAYETGFVNTRLTLLSWNGNSIDGFTNEGGYLTADKDLNITINQNYIVSHPSGSLMESTLFIKINDDMYELPYTGGNATQSTFNSNSMSFVLSQGDEVRAYVFSRQLTELTAPDSTYFLWSGFITAIKSVVGDIVEYDPLSIHKTDTIFNFKVDTIVTPVLQGDTVQVGSMATKNFWAGTQAEFDLIGSPDPNTVYFINNGWWALAFLLLFSLTGWGQKWDAVKVGATDITRIYQGSNIIWEKESEQGAYIIIKTSSTSSTWTPQLIVNTGATLHWEVTGTAAYSVDANKPTFNFSNAGEKVITITSDDGLAGLEELVLSSLAVSEFTHSDLTALTLLVLSNNQLTSLDEAGLTALTSLYLSSNQLTSFDGTRLAELTNLDLGVNQLTSFNGTGLSALTWLRLDYNQLTSFDGTGLSALTEIRLDNNQLTSSTINALLDYLISNTVGFNFDARNQTGGGCGDPAKIAALDAIWGTVLVDPCP